MYNYKKPGVHTWDDILVESDCITFIKHKEFSTVETVRELFEVFVNASLQLVHLFAYILWIWRKLILRMALSI